jgi:hypothetical protein
MPDTTLAVAGLGRCGLTMTMQMLDAGGLDVWGEPPAYEPNHYVTAWSSDAVKLVDPIGNELSGLLPEPGRLKWLWLARDAKEQAKSMAKMIEGTGRAVEWRRLRKTIRPSTREHLRFIERRDEKLHRVKFGNAVTGPEGYARHLDERVLPSTDLDTDAMAAVVEDRSPKVEADLYRELSFL